MTLAHGGSRLFLENMSLIIPDGAYLFPMYKTMESTTGDIPIVTRTAEFSSGVKKFKGSVYVGDKKELRYDISHLNMKDRGVVACWIYTSNTMLNPSNNIFLLKLGSDVNNDPYADTVTLWIQNSIPKKYRFFTNKGLSSNHITDSQTMDFYGDEGTWNHFVIQWDKDGLPSGNTKELYINGYLRAEGTSLNLPENTLTYLHVGSWYHGGSFQPNTYFEQLILHDKGLSAEYIRNMYHASAPYYDMRDHILFWGVDTIV